MPDEARAGGRLFCVSLGPGHSDYMTPRARTALECSDVIVGYKTYLDLIAPLLNGREVLSTGMKGEVERCRIAVEKALEGKSVSVVSSGDVGIYGMAGLILEICRTAGIDLFLDKDNFSAGRSRGLLLEVIPGVPAFVAAASLLGAPLMHDFCSISLSDLLTPWELIEKRIRLAAQGDFVIAIYNPRSRKRHWQLGAAAEILLRYRGPDTPVGIVSRAMREGQEAFVTTLGAMADQDVDMQTVIIVCNSDSFRFNDLICTPRGYGSKYPL